MKCFMSTECGTFRTGLSNGDDPEYVIIISSLTSVELISCSSLHSFCVVLVGGLYDIKGIGIAIYFSPKKRLEHSA